MNKVIDLNKDRSELYGLGASIEQAVFGYLMQCKCEPQYMFEGTFGDFITRYRVEWVDEQKLLFDIVEAWVYVDDTFLVNAEHKRLVESGLLDDLQEARYSPLVVSFELTPRDGGLKQWTGTILN